MEAKLDAGLGIAGERDSPHVTGVVQRAVTTPAPASPDAIQRWAFVGGQQVEAGGEGLTPETKQLAADELVHDYETTEELRAHAEGNTDYLGNLPGGTWVRFSPDGINVLGERLRFILDMIAARAALRNVRRPS